ncbi:FAD-dependent oxidoreductase [Agrobacterium larrymoorei]|uniref:Ferredoxin--NADP+ reductase n=1 Tax=Agrobacterium larrymoorei TaxID=160699 RepID=A0ABU0UDB4_9HYPH|nr:FAD-dependent oxidoreductase [Agrobacterium larrymoorei]MDQ1182925.1 ferredoxin--NADP+ reductase [Agrobacterium larrymoorei]
MKTPQYRVAIVGAGPSGFYAAEALLRAQKDVSVDLFERLPVPYGLVRFGVAPDHPKLKQVTAIFDRIAAMPGFRFVGGVEVGADISVETLRGAYHAVILSTGASLGREIGLPGESLAGNHQASDFVGWYNGHPDYRDLAFNFSGERALVIGHGNVALDVARILLKTPEELRQTDIAAHALEALSESRIKEVHLIGRRGPAETRFSAKELLEFDALSACDPGVERDDLPSKAFVIGEGFDSERKASMDVLERFSRHVATKERRCLFRFHLEPIRFEGDERVRSAVFRRNHVEEPSGQSLTIDTTLVFFSVGRRTMPIEGVAYDRSGGVHANQNGRLVEQNGVVPGLYTCGWSKRGPQGTIGTNRACALDTVEKILIDLDSLPSPEDGAADRLVSSLGGRYDTPLDFDAWRLIDSAEVARGRAIGKPREKFVSIDDMIAAARTKGIAC